MHKAVDPIKNEPIIRITDLNFSYRSKNGYVKIFENLKFNVTKGTILGLLGPNGCGKSTLLRILAKLQFPDSGEVNTMEGSKNFGMIFQQSEKNIIPWLKVRDNILIACKLKGFELEKSIEYSERSLVKFGIKNLANRYPRELSGGQIQLVSIARWFAIQPPLLLLDEPFSMLDVLQRARVMSIINEITKEKKMTLIIVDHNVSELAKIINHAIILTQIPSTIAAEFDFSNNTDTAIRSNLLWTKLNKNYGLSLDQ